MSSPPLEPDSPLPSDRPYTEPKPVGHRWHWFATTAALAFGIVTPVICLIMDPGIVITRGVDPDHTLLRGAEPLFLTWVALEMGILALWLIFGGRLQRLGAWLAGGLFLGAALAWVMAIVLSPYTLMALVFGAGLATENQGTDWMLFVYGLLAMSIFLTGAVYFFQAIRAATLDRERQSVWGRLWRAFLGACVVIALAIAVQIAADLVRPNAPPSVVAGG